MSECAGFLRRFFAWFIDGLVMGVLAAILGLILGGCVALTIGTESDFLAFLTSTAACLLWVILAAFQFIYFGYFWSKDDQSVGMKLVNIRVVRRSETETISFWRAGFRGSLGYYISGFVFGLASSGLLLTATRKPGTTSCLIRGSC